MIKRTKIMAMGLALSASTLGLAPTVNALPDISHDFTNAYWQDLAGSNDVTKDGLRFRTSLLGGDGGLITWNPGGGDGGDPDWNQKPCHDLGYACAGDGLGILGVGDDDEISIPTSSTLTQVLSITFEERVNITQLSFLDLFDESTGLEAASWRTAGSETIDTLDAAQDTGSNGFASIEVALLGVKTIHFGVLCSGGKDCSNIDFSLAGMNVTAVPIPAAAWLFGSGLIGLAGIARRRKAA